MSDFQRATVRVGYAGLNGTGVSGAEKTSILSRLTGLEALTPPVVIGDLGDVDTTTDAPATGDRMVFDGTNWIPETPAAITFTSNMSYSIGDGVSTIATGNKFGFKLKFAGTITGWDIGSDASTTSSVQLWQRAAGSFPPTSGQTVLTMTLTADTENSATGLSIAFSANDWFFFNVSANNNAKWLGPCVAFTREVGP